MECASSAVKIYHVNDVSIYLGRQRGEGSPLKERAKGLIFGSAPSAGVSNVRKVKSTALGSKQKTRAQKVSFRSVTPPHLLST